MSAKKLTNLGSRIWANRVGLLCRTILCFVAFLSKAASFHDPDYVIDLWEAEQGVPQQSVTSMVQAPNGYLWFSSFGGLVRFDGLNFKVFEPTNTPDLPSSTVITLHQDEAHQLWVSTTRGLVVSTSPDWTRFRPVSGWTGDYVRTYAGLNGVLCLTSFNGKVFTNSLSGLVELPTPPGRLGHGYQAHVDANGKIWVVQNQFVGSWNGQRWVTSQSSAQITNKLAGVGTARDGSLLVLTTKEILRLRNDEVVSRTALPMRSFDCWEVKEDSRGSFWLVTVERGIIRVDPSGQFRRYNTAAGLNHDLMRFMFEDRDGNIWVGSNGAGLLRFKRRTFQAYGLESGISNHNVKAIIELAPGRMLAGAYGDPMYLIEGQRVSAWLDPKGIPHQGYFLQCLLQDRRGHRWIGTYGHGLKNVESDPLNFSGCGNNITALFEDATGRVWVGGDWSIAVLAAGQWKLYVSTNNLALGQVHHFAQNPKDGSVWAVSPNRLLRLDQDQWREIPGPNGHALKDGAFLHFETDGTLWLGRANLGLVRWREGQWSTVSEAQGLPKGSITSLLDDGAGYWWLGSDQGILRVAREDLHRAADRAATQVRHQLFTTADGMPAKECAGLLQSVATKDSQGRLWYATAKGVTTVNPRELVIKSNPPPVIIEQVSFTDRSGKRHTTLSPANDDTIDIPAGSHELEIQYTAISLGAPEKIRFAYLWEGSDAGWVDAGNRRTLSFHTLEPGTFLLRVKAANEDGVWNETGARVTLAMQPFYWQTLWFRGLVLVAIVVVVGATAWRVTQNKLQRRIEKLEQERILVLERARLAAVMEGTTDLVGFCDPQGQIAYVNGAGRRLLGWTETEDLKDLRIADLHRPEVTQRVIETVLPAAERTGVWTGETSFLHRDGREVPTSQVVICHKGADGKVEFFSTIARDITDRIKTETQILKLNAELEQRVEERTAELKAMTKDLEAFSYSVAHDLRAPLHNISGYVGLIKSAVGPLNETGTRYMQVVNTQVSRMATLIEDLLAFSRISCSAVAKSTVNLSELLEQAREMLGLDLQERNIVWKIGPLPTVRADPGLLRQVFFNLVGNAVKYSRNRDPAVIEVGSREEANGDWVVFVRDNGAGFDMRDAGKLLEAFERLHNSKEFEGSGIGLANANRIIQRHGGRIWFEAELDKGAVFYFSLPK